MISPGPKKKMLIYFAKKSYVHQKENPTIHFFIKLIDNSVKSSYYFDNQQLSK